MLFLKDKISNNITGHVAVDFQLLRYCSPSVDLAYYLFTSVKTAVRLSRFEELFSGYLETLNKVSNELGHPINMIYEVMKYFSTINCTDFVLTKLINTKV